MQICTRSKTSCDLDKKVQYSAPCPWQLISLADGFLHMLHIENRVLWGYVSQMTLIPMLNCVCRQKTTFNRLSVQFKTPQDLYIVWPDDVELSFIKGLTRLNIFWWKTFCRMPVQLKPWPCPHSGTTEGKEPCFLLVW